MRFNLEHDWQGNMSTPPTKVGERAKIRLLILLCAVWLLMGLVGHDPWKPLESSAISTIKDIIDNGNFIAPSSTSTHQLSNPPLYYLTAALSAISFHNVLPLHDGARIASGLWMFLTLTIIGMTGRELWGKGFGRQTTFIFISSIGLIVSAHTITPETSALTGLTASFYALALANRRPYRASVLLGTGMGVCFLSTGLLPISIVVLSCLALAGFFKQWRTIRFAKVTAFAALICSLITVPWLLLCLYQAPAMLNLWWEKALSQLQQGHFYLLNLLLWYTWPSLPLAVWSLWRYHTQILNQARFQLCIIFFVAACICIGFLGENKDIYALPLLIPLTALASGGIETLKRGAASALNWFGLILFGLMSFLIWLGWCAMMSGSPAKLKERLIFLSGLTQLPFNIVAFIIATAITLIWLFAALRSQHSNRAAATNWAIGMTCVWTLLMTLWLPMINSARTYSQVFTSLKSALPSQYSCITSDNVGDSQLDLLHYYANIKTYPHFYEESKNCDLYLVQDYRKPKMLTLGNGWHEIWHGQRTSERKESFRLFQQDQ